MRFILLRSCYEKTHKKLNHQILRKAKIEFTVLRVSYYCGFSKMCCYFESNIYNRSESTSCEFCGEFYTNNLYISLAFI